MEMPPGSPEPAVMPHMRGATRGGVPVVSVEGSIQPLF